MVNVAINEFGRIGRLVLSAMHEKAALEMVEGTFLPGLAALDLKMEKSS
jgi:glyceraldehyde-3-phosphate dehydrogenase/erythrose-4-phosphate dehydrogenase